MKLFSLRCTTPFGRRQSSLSSVCFLGPLLILVVILITDACDAPPQFPGMVVKDSRDSYSPGETAQYECRIGYRRKVPLANMTITCQNNNTWSDITDGCRKKACPIPEDLLNGRIEFLQGNVVLGTQIKYICNEGYNLVGSDAILTCILIDTTLNWDKNPPVCDVARCPPPANIENGKYSNVKDVYAYHEVVHYSCNPTSGDEFSLIGNSTLICSSETKWSSDPPKCKVVKCPFPTIQNGEQVSGFGKNHNYKSQVTFKCRSGFVMDGNSTVVCEEDNEWVPAIPKCVKATTPMSTTPNAGDFPPGPPISSFPDGGTIAVIVVSILVPVIVISAFVYKYSHSRKSGKAEVTAAYTTCKNTSVSPAEQEI